MIYITVSTGPDIDFHFKEFWIADEHKPNILAALGLLSENMTIAEALEMTS